MRPVEILLVEDNVGDTVLIRQVLATECQLPINLHIARDGEQALLLLTNPAFELDLIILDLNIPKIGGLALLERWRLMETPKVVFSSSLNEREQQRTLALGARQFVGKPSNITEFMDAICGMVQKWAAQ
jgi:CheY-like chemotaxis protein